MDTAKCKCGGIFQFVYHVWWKCRMCGRWRIVNG